MACRESLTLLIGLGSLYKIRSCAGGGAAVAEMLGGRLVHPHTTDGTSGGC